MHLPVASLPAVEFPTMRVQASRPGADPETMAATIAAPLERRLGEIAGVTEMTSTSSHGSTGISMQFDLEPQHRRRRPRRAGGPQRRDGGPAGRPAAGADVPQVNPSASPVLILALTSKTMTDRDIYDTADTIIAQRMSQVDGVAQVTVSGAEQPAMRVRVNPTLLASMGVSMEDVRNADRCANDLSPVGAVDGDKQAITLATNDAAAQPGGL